MAEARGFAARVAEAGVMILDGAMATELERAGHSLGDRLWSAGVLDRNPQAIAAVHRAYLEAGADCLTSAGYQASIPGFVRAGYTSEEAEELYRRSVRLALRERDAFVLRNGGETRRCPLVALSIGPYAVWLADGSEYKGYGREVSDARIAEFQRPRVELALEELAEHGLGEEVLAFETIPTLREALVLAELNEEAARAECWISFACRDGERTAGGDRVEDCARALEGYRGVAGVGVNCTGPQHVQSVLKRMGGESSKVLVCYPNSGERYEAGEKRWTGARARGAVQSWWRSGARAVGGCCRTGPEDVKAWVEWRG